MRTLPAIVAAVTVAAFPLILPAQSAREDPCDDVIVRSELTLTYPGRLETPDTRGSQLSTTHSHTYLVRESFEAGSMPAALCRGTGRSWEIREDGAADGNAFLEMNSSIAWNGVDGIAADRGNWLALGPFDLSDFEEAYFNFRVSLGNPDTGQPAALAALVSADGRTFHGLEWAGATCGWKYCDLELNDVPGLGDVAGEPEIWVALLSTGAAGQGASVKLDLLSLLAVDQDLAQPPAVATRAEPGPKGVYEDLLEHYAPYIIQEVECTKFGDKITRYDYDGNHAADDNWNNLGVNCGGDCNDMQSGCAQARPLPAYVYATVIETETDYYLCYALSHPADDFHCHEDTHENDMEGIVMMVNKTGSTYGSLCMVQTQAHHDYFQYLANCTEGKEVFETREDIDGRLIHIRMWGDHPVVYVEGGGHGIRGRPGEFFWGWDGDSDWCVHYRYTGVAEDPPSWKFSHNWLASDFDGSDSMRAGYDLRCLTCEFWQRRLWVCGSGCMFPDVGPLELNRFDLGWAGTVFTGDTCGQGANPPWAWTDNDDCSDHGMCGGEWFLDPAHYHNFQFTWDPPRSETYEYNPFTRNHICGEVYDLLGAFEEPEWGRYIATCDLVVPEDESLWVGNGVIMQFAYGPLTFTADGPMTMMGSPEPVIISRGIYQVAGMKVYGRAQFHDGGAIRFPN